MDEETLGNRHEISVLAAPSNFILEDTYGSEYLWPHQIMKFTSMHNVRYVALTYWANLSERIPGNRIVSFRNNGPPENSTLNRLKFTFLCWKEGAPLLNAKKFDVLHQMSIGFGQGFNPTVLGGQQHQAAFVVGPVQAPQTYVSTDGAGVSSRDFGRMVNSDGPNRISKALTSISDTFLETLFAETLKKADRIVVINEIAEKLCSRYVSRKKMVKIPIGVDAQRFACTPTHNTNEVLFVGFLVKRKGVDHLINAFKQVLKEVPEAKLRIIGDGPQRTTLQALAKSLNIESRICFEGLVPNRDLPKYYEMCDLLCLPSLSESYGNVVLEAFASGRPVVSSRLPALAELITEGLSGCLTPVGDEAGLAEGIAKILSNRLLKEKMGAFARKRVEEEFGWPIIGKRYAETYRELVDS